MVWLFNVIQVIADPILLSNVLNYQRYILIQIKRRISFIWRHLLIWRVTATLIENNSKNIKKNHTIFNYIPNHRLGSVLIPPPTAYNECGCEPSSRDAQRCGYISRLRGAGEMPIWLGHPSLLLLTDS